MRDTVKSIPLRSRKYPGLATLVDDEDYPLLEQYAWHPDKRPDGLFYARAHVNGEHVYMHRLLLPGYTTVDHRDGNPLNNQKNNLRPATQKQQRQNSSAKKNPIDSPYKGVYRAPAANKTKRWRAAIRLNGKLKHLGLFITEEEAARAYDSAAREAFGQYARVNFPQSEGDA